MWGDIKKLEGVFETMLTSQKHASDIGTTLVLLMVGI